MKDIYIFGASGYAKETALLIEEMGEYRLRGFVDKDCIEGGETEVNHISYPILSEEGFLFDLQKGTTGGYYLYSQ